jgi:hypothetical protein
MADPRAWSDINIWRQEMLKGIEAIPGGGTGSGTGSTAASVPFEINKFRAITNSAGNWAIGDILTRVRTIPATGTGSTRWFNAAGVELVAPTFSAVPVVGTDVVDLDAQSATTTSQPIIRVEYFKPIQTLIPAGIPAGLPNVGQPITFTVTPIAGIASNVAFQANDIVVITDMTDAVANAVAYVQVVSVTGNTVSGTVSQRSNSAAAGTVFTAGASTAVRHTEISGQTRLPNIPATAVSAEVTAVESNQIAAASVTVSSPYQTVAQLLMGGWPLARAGCKIGGVADIDGVDRMGFNLSREAVKKFETRSEVDAARILSAAPMALLPILEVEYR